MKNVVILSVGFLFSIIAVGSGHRQPPRGYHVIDYGLRGLGRRPWLMVYADQTDLVFIGLESDEVTDQELEEWRNKVRRQRWKSRFRWLKKQAGEVVRLIPELAEGVVAINSR